MDGDPDARRATIYWRSERMSIRTRILYGTDWGLTGKKVSKGGR